MKKNSTSNAARPSKKGPSISRTKSPKSTPRMTVGIDLGDKQSAYCILDAEGDVLSEGTIRNPWLDMSLHIVCRHSLPHLEISRGEQALGGDKPRSKFVGVRVASCCVSVAHMPAFENITLKNIKHAGITTSGAKMSSRSRNQVGIWE